MRGVILGFCLLGMISALGADLIYRERARGDVWVYVHAFNPRYESRLRSWGDGTYSVDPNGYPPAFNFSYSYVKWDVSSIRAGVYYRVLEARIELVHTQPGYSLQLGQENPLEARSLDPNWEEETWDFSDPNNPNPGDQVFGIGDLANYNADNDFPLLIDLLEGTADFEAYFNAAVQTRQLNLAFTSKMNPGGQGGSAFYRFYSKDDAGGRGPVLFIRYAVAGDTNEDNCVNDRDLANVLLDFGGPPQHGNTDLNGDGLVNDADLSLVLLLFGNGC